MGEYLGRPIRALSRALPQWKSGLPDPFWPVS